MTNSSSNSSSSATTQCIVQTIDPLTPSVYRILLKPQSSFSFKAGQYLFVHMGEDDKRPFSIASASYEQETIELHIGADESNKFAYEVLQRMQNDKKIHVSGGLGEAFYSPQADRPVILIAGGTGFSYAYSILKEAIHRDPNTHITLYWGGRHTEDLYLTDELTKLAVQHPHFTFIPVVEFANDNWQGRTGWVHRAVLADYPSLAERQVYIAGRFEMAKTAREDFLERGLAQDSLFGDAYAFI